MSTVDPTHLRQVNTQMCSNWRNGQICASPLLGKLDERQDNVLGLRILFILYGSLFYYTLECSPRNWSE